MVDAYIKSSPLWSLFQILRLTVPIRNAEDLPFADFVDSIGDGAGPDISLDMVAKVNTDKELASFVYPDAILTHPEQCLRRAILAPTNMQVDEYNRHMLSRLCGEERLSHSFGNVNSSIRSRQALSCLGCQTRKGIATKTGSSAV